MYKIVQSFTKKYYVQVFLAALFGVYIFLSSDLTSDKLTVLTISSLLFIASLINNVSYQIHGILQISLFSYAYFYIFNQVNLTTVSFVFIISIFYNVLKNPSDKFKYKNLKTSYPVVFILLFVVTLLLQNVYIIFETIDWDVHSYLVTSLDIGRGNLPYEQQWEDKQPLLFYFYFVLIKIANGSFVLFKLLNDMIIFICSVLIFIISKNYFEREHVESIFSSLIFISLMSIPWGTVEYSEIYSLVFLATAFIKINNTKTSSIFLSGISFSVSTLINIGTLLFIIPFLINLYSSTKQKINIISNFSIFSAGLLIPHFIFLIVYASQGLSTIYLTTLITIPFGYTGNSSLKVDAFNSFLKSYFDFNPLLYFILILCIFMRLYGIADELYKKRSLNVAKNIIVFYSFTAVLFFLLAAKGFNHHLIFFIFFISINYKKVHLHKVKGTLFGLILIFMMIQVSNYQKTEYRDMFNLNNLENSYSLKNLSQEIDRYFINDYTVLALDYNLLLFYLDKPNYSYVIHPTNHFEPWIRESLISVNKISEVNVIRMIDEKPDVIICSHMSIAQGLVDNEYFNCEVSDYYPEYTKLDTSAYKENRKREYYFDPYKDISVFVKMRK